MASASSRTGRSVYLMHAGWPYLQETIAIMHVYPQVYADVAAIDWLRPREVFHEYLRALVRNGLAKRLMVGSDQMVWPEGIGMAIEGIESAGFLREEQKRDIFYHNAVRFLRLDEKKVGPGRRRSPMDVHAVGVRQRSCDLHQSVRIATSGTSAVPRPMPWPVRGR